MTSDELSKMMTLTPPNRSFNIPEKEFTESFGMTPDDVAQKTGIPKSRLDRMIAEVARKMKCSPAIALKQAKYFGIHDSLLLNLTVKYNKGKLDN
ncbi:MAG: helix-turn-helix transcriptional regulator [Candidatus Electrothrix sp. YB6]